MEASSRASGGFARCASGHASVRPVQTLYVPFIASLLLNLNNSTLFSKKRVIVERSNYNLTGEKSGVPSECQEEIEAKAKAYSSGGQQTKAEERSQQDSD
jgi:hypothetical protein